MRFDLTVFFSRVFLKGEGYIEIAEEKKGEFRSSENNVNLDLLRSKIHTRTSYIAIYWSYRIIHLLISVLVLFYRVYQNKRNSSFVLNNFRNTISS
jgi:hypothetical protein